MKSTRWRGEAALGLLVAVAMLVVGGGAIWLRSTRSVHQDAASVPSTAATTPAERFAGPVEESRRLTRALIVGDDLLGLSVAVAVDGEIGVGGRFGWADVDRRTRLTRSRGSVSGGRL